MNLAALLRLVDPTYCHTGLANTEKQLKRMKGTLDKLNASYDDMKSQIHTAHNDTFATITESSVLVDQRRQIETKQELLGAFKKRFIMTDDEVAVLTQTVEPVGDDFFEALAKAKTISTDCEVLLGFENQRLGLELLEQTSKHINLGFHKLYKWVQREFKTLNLENPQMNPLIRKSLRVLAERPSLFQNCLDFFAEARERILTDSFYTALTGTTPSSLEDPSIKPIDLVAHDALRYVGDMLAWIHSAAVSEREALEVLFVAEGEELAKGLKSGLDTKVWQLATDDESEQQADFNAIKALSNLVDRDISGASRILRQRVEQVMRTNEEVIQAYKLANLINFYHATFQKLLGPSANLVESMRSLESEGLRQFKALIRDNVTTLWKEFQQRPSDLGPPKFLQQNLLQLDTIAKTYDSSLSVASDREAEFDAVLSEAFEPFISGCESMAKSMDPLESAIFLLNCKLTASQHLTPYSFTRRRASKLRQDVEEESKKLIESQYRFLVHGSGLESLFKLTTSSDSKNNLCTAAALGQASQTLDDFLPSALMDAIGNLKELQDTSFSREITEKAAEQFCQAFEKLESFIEKLDEADDGTRRDVFPRTSSEIRVLLS